MDPANQSAQSAQSTSKPEPEPSNDEPANEAQAEAESAAKPEPEEKPEAEIPANDEPKKDV